MALTLVVAGQINVPLEDQKQAANIDLGVQFPYTQRADFERVYAAAVADDLVDFGTLNVGGAKGVLVKVTSGSATIKFMQGVTVGNLAWPLVPGAYFLYMNPSGGFPTGAKVTTTGAATVKFIAVG